MRTPKISLAIAATVVALQISSLGAQTRLDKLKNTTPEQRATLQTLLMQEKLGLTPDQKPKVAAINLKYANKMEPILKGSSSPLMELREMKEINAQKEAELKQILTPAQFDTYLASKEEMRQKFEQQVLEKAAGS